MNNDEHQYLKCTPILPPDRVRFGIDHYASLPVSALTPKAKGVIIGAIETALCEIGISKDSVTYSRHLITGYLALPKNQPLRPMSSKELTNGQWIGFSRWHTKYMGDGLYIQRPTFTDEVRWILAKANEALVTDQGQMSMTELLEQAKNEVPEGDLYDLDSFRKYIKENYDKFPNGNKIGELLHDENL